MNTHTCTQLRNHEFLQKSGIQIPSVLGYSHRAFLDLLHPLFIFPFHTEKSSSPKYQHLLKSMVYLKPFQNCFTHTTSKIRPTKKSEFICSSSLLLTLDLRYIFKYYLQKLLVLVIFFSFFSVIIFSHEV